MDPDYVKHYRTLYENHWWWRAREEMLLQELRRRLPNKPGLSILDVGCGDALFFGRLGQFGDVEGVESTPELVDPDGPYRSRITVGPFDASFHSGKSHDLILMLDVLEHLDAPQQALRHGISLLKPDGIILITVPAFRMIWTRHDELNNHRTRYTKQSFGQLARFAGMRVISSRYFFTWLFVAKLLTRMIETLVPSDPAIPGIPSPLLNRILYGISRAEEKLLGNRFVPFGSSLLVVGTGISQGA